MSNTIGDLLESARARQFIGRSQQVRRIEALLGDRNSHRILVLVGPGGIGKTTLAQHAVTLAGMRNLDVWWLDGAALAWDSGLHEADWLSAGTRMATGKASADETETQSLVVIDGFEHLKAVEEHLFNTVLVSMPATTRFILVGRAMPSPRFLAEPGWRSLIEVCEIAPFTRNEVKEYLETFGADSNRTNEFFAITQGHPLTLSLMTTFSQRPESTELPPKSSTNVVLERFLEHLPDERHRSALQVCAFVPTATRPMLEAVARMDDAGAVIRWLEILSFCNADSGGFRLHSVVQDHIRTQLLRSNPQQAKQICFGLVDYLLRRLESPHRRDITHTLSDLAFLVSRVGSTENPFSVSDPRDVIPRSTLAADMARIREICQGHEGERSLSVLEYWLARGAEGLSYFDSTGTVKGFSLMLRSNQLERNQETADPALQRLYPNSWQPPPMARRPSSHVTG